MIKHKTPTLVLGLTLLLLAISPPPIAAQDDSLAGSFLSGLLDTITSTADSKDCPGVCVHTLATLICYEVLEDVPCPSASMKCCIESAPTKNVSSLISGSSSSSSSSSTSTTTTTTTTSTRRPTTTTSSTPKPKPKTTATTTTHKPKTTQKKPATTVANKTTTKKPAAAATTTTTTASAAASATKKTDKDKNEDEKSGKFFL